MIEVKSVCQPCASNPTLVSIDCECRSRPRDGVLLWGSSSDVGHIQYKNINSMKGNCRQTPTCLHVEASSTSHFNRHTPGVYSLLERKQSKRRPGYRAEQT